MALLTKSVCCFEGLLIIPRVKKNSRMMLNDFRQQIYQYFHCLNLFMIFVQLLVCSVVDNDRKFVKTKRKTSWLVSSPTKFQWNRHMRRNRVCYWCSYRVFTSSVIYNWTENSKMNCLMVTLSKPLSSHRSSKNQSNACIISVYIWKCFFKKRFQWTTEHTYLKKT